MELSIRISQRRTPASSALCNELLGQEMHLDPDFDFLTYGDNGARRGKGVAGLERGDFIAFFSSLRPTRDCEHTLIYALIGFYRVREVCWAKSVGRERSHQAPRPLRERHHRPRRAPGQRQASSVIPIGEWRDRSYRVRTDLLERWGHLSCRDGFIQRSAVPPSSWSHRGSCPGSRSSRQSSSQRTTRDSEATNSDPRLRADPQRRSR
jgi:hypothetical protein